MKSDKMLYLIYADIESLIKKIDSHKKNTKKSSTTKMKKTKTFSLRIFKEIYFDI